MLKELILSASIALASIPATAEPASATNPAQATAIAAEKCKQGCLILSPADVKQLEQSVNAFAKQAFNQGVAAFEAEIPAICKDLSKSKV